MGHGTRGFTETGVGSGAVVMWSEELPDYDEIKGLHCSLGMYSLDRWPAFVTHQISFLKQVEKKFGKNARLAFVDPSDGYHGYIFVVNN